MRDWMDLNGDGKIDGAEMMFAGEMLCTSREEHVAFLINRGVQPLEIKERLGHRDIKVTLNTYGHLYPNAQKKVADLLDMEYKKAPTNTND